MDITATNFTVRVVTPSGGIVKVATFDVDALRTEAEAKTLAEEEVRILAEVRSGLGTWRDVTLTATYAVA